MRYILAIDENNKVVYAFKHFYASPKRLSVLDIVSIIDYIDDIEMNLSPIIDSLEKQVPLDDMTYEEVKAMYEIVKAIYNIYSDNSVSQSKGVLNSLFTAGVISTLSHNGIVKLECIKRMSLNNKIKEYSDNGYTVILMWDGTILKPDGGDDNE